MEAPQTRNESATHAFTWTESEGPSTAVVLATADVTGEDPTEMDPLYAAVDPDSLDALFAGTGASRRNGTVEFEYHGCRITVRADGRGTVRKRPAGETAGSGSDPMEEHR